MEEIEEVVEEPKKKNRVIEAIIDILLVLIIMFLVANIILAYTNFTRLRDKKENLYFILDKKTYDVKEKHVKIYNGGIYKLTDENDGRKETISVKLWFMKDPE